MHHYDVRTCIHLGMCPLLEPIIRSEPLLHPFRENRRERVIPEDVVMLVHDHEVCVLAGVTNAFKDALRILLIRGVSGRAGAIGRRLIFLVSGFAPQPLYALPLPSAPSP